MPTAIRDNDVNQQYQNHQQRLKNKQATKVKPTLIQRRIALKGVTESLFGARNELLETEIL